MTCVLKDKKSYFLLIRRYVTFGISMFGESLLQFV